MDIIQAFLAIGMLFIIYLVRNDKGQAEPKRALIFAGVFGFLAIIAAGIINDLLLNPQIRAALDNPAKATHIAGSTLFVGSLKVGITEEILKFVPLAIFIYKKPYFNEVTDGVIYFGICGMIFGSIENVLYVSQFGGLVGLFRLVLTPFFHAALVVIPGLFLIRCKLWRKSFLILVLGLILAITLHTLYDFGLFYGSILTLVMSGVIALTLNIGIFRAYKKARALDKQQGRYLISNYEVGK